MNHRHWTIEYRSYDYDVQSWLDYWLAALLAAHQDKLKKIQEQAALDKLRAAQRKFLLDMGWEEKTNGWWQSPHQYYKGKFAGLYQFDHAVNSMQLVLREKRGIV